MIFKATDGEMRIGGQSRDPLPHFSLRHRLFAPGSQFVENFRSSANHACTNRRERVPAPSRRGTAANLELTGSAQHGRQPVPCCRAMSVGVQV